MRELTAAILISAILFFLAFGNALRYRYADNSLRSFRLRRREYLTQVLKQISATAKVAKAGVGAAVKSASSSLYFRNIHSGRFHKNAWMWELERIISFPMLASFHVRGLVSILNDPPLLRPPIV